MKTANIERYLNSVGKQVVKDAKIFLNKSKGATKLANTIKYKVVPIGTLSNPSFSLEWSMAGYGQFVDKGVKGSRSRRYYKTWEGKRKDSPYKFGTGSSLVGKAKGGMSGIMSKWIKKKGFQWKDKETGRFMSHKSMGYIIARSIYSKGIHGISFFQKSLALGMEGFSTGLAQALAQDVIDNLKPTN